MRKLLKPTLPAVKSQDHALAETELTGVRRAASAAGNRMAALEREADAIHTKTLLSCTARVVSTQERGVHALITDDNGVTVEISGGALMASVSSERIAREGRQAIREGHEASVAKKED